MDSTAFAAMIATESEGVTKNLAKINKFSHTLVVNYHLSELSHKETKRKCYLLPRTMLRSASPSAAAPNSGGSS